MYDLELVGLELAEELFGPLKVYICNIYSVLHLLHRVTIFSLEALEDHPFAALQILDVLLNGGFNEAHLDLVVLLRMCRNHYLVHLLLSLALDLVGKLFLNYIHNFVLDHFLDTHNLLGLEFLLE